MSAIVYNINRNDLPQLLVTSQTVRIEKLTPHENTCVLFGFDDFIMALDNLYGHELCELFPFNVKKAFDLAETCVTTRRLLKEIEAQILDSPHPVLPQDLQIPEKLLQGVNQVERSALLQLFHIYMELVIVLNARNTYLMAVYQSNGTKAPLKIQPTFGCYTYFANALPSILTCKTSAGATLALNKSFASPLSTLEVSEQYFSAFSQYKDLTEIDAESLLKKIKFKDLGFPDWVSRAIHHYTWKEFCCLQLTLRSYKLHNEIVLCIPELKN